MSFVLEPKYYNEHFLYLTIHHLCHIRFMYITCTNNYYIHNFRTVINNNNNNNNNNC